MFRSFSAAVVCISIGLVCGQQPKAHAVEWTYVVLDPETGSPKGQTKPSGQVEIAATNQGSFDWSQHMPTKLADSVGGQRATSNGSSATPALAELCTIDKVPYANAPTTVSATKVAGSATSDESSRNTVMVMTTNPFAGQTQSGLKSNTSPGTAYLIIKMKPIYISSYQTGGSAHAVRPIQVSATNFARPSIGAAQVKRISR